MCHSSWETTKAGLHCHRTSFARHKPITAPGGGNRLEVREEWLQGHQFETTHFKSWTLFAALWLLKHSRPSVCSSCCSEHWRTGCSCLEGASFCTCIWSCLVSTPKPPKAPWKNLHPALMQILSSFPFLQVTKGSSVWKESSFWLWGFHASRRSVRLENCGSYMWIGRHKSCSQVWLQTFCRDPCTASGLLPPFSPDLSL